MIDVPSYLGRIGYSGPTEPSITFLCELHRSHLFAVPFENLNIALGRPIVLDEDIVIHKVVQQRRGGFCYELNGAFAALLRALGFQVRLLSGRVSRPHDEEGPEFDHLALRVDLEEPWLADVGFGESFLEPLRMQAATEQADPAGRFRLAEIGERLRLEKFEADGHWRPQYSFSLEPRRLEEFAGMCRYHQTSPESSFTQRTICSRATPNGRITLAGMKFIVTRAGQREERMLHSEQEKAEILKEEFGIIEPAPIRVSGSAS